jgi:Fe-S oxidoreductase
MDQVKYQQLKFCSLCQDPCRTLFPAGLKPTESRMSSAMAYLALAVHEKFVDFTPAVETLLGDLEGCSACRAACPHGIDAPALVEEVRDAAEKARR